MVRPASAVVDPYRLASPVTLMASGDLGEDKVWVIGTILTETSEIDAADGSVPPTVTPELTQGRRTVAP
jgi:hypothetical protein